MLQAGGDIAVIWAGLDKVIVGQEEYAFFRKVEAKVAGCMARGVDGDGIGVPEIEDVAILQKPLRLPRRIIALADQKVFPEEGLLFE